MLELKTKQGLASEAHKMAGSLNLVRYRGITYLPADYETGMSDPTPDPERTMWLPLNTEAVRRLAVHNFKTLFANDGELRSFEFMVSQNSVQIDKVVDTLLVRCDEGLKVLDGTGVLCDPDGSFVPNTLTPMLNEDAADVAEVLNVVQTWVDSDEEAASLLHHLATGLAPGYSAVKYVLLLGKGRNGKSLLLKMLMAIFGTNNVSAVTRQNIAEQSPTVTELNGKLLNIIFDGQAEFLKDSGREKSLIAGEEVPIRKLYDSTPTMVRTNALFIEGLNKEPKSSDKSTALQKRLVRFQFPNVYPEDRKFEKHMLSDKMLGALLSLLISHYVVEDRIAELLAPTTKAMELQLEHMYVNSMALQFLKYVDEDATLELDQFLGEPITDMVAAFRQWRLKENDVSTWAEPDVVNLFSPLLNTERKSVRVNGSPRKVRVVESLSVEATAFIESLEGDKEDGHIGQLADDDVAALVAD